MENRPPDGTPLAQEVSQLGHVGIDGSLAQPSAEDKLGSPPNDNTDLIESDENILAVVRKHWIGIADIYGLSFISLVALIILGLFVLPGMNLSAQAAGLVTAAAIVISVVLAAIVLTMVYVYHQSRLTLTDKSLVQIVQRGLFNKKISRLSMSNVEDVNVEQRGIIAHMLNFGILTVQTAGQEDNFIFTNCPNANVYAEKILEARQAYVKQHDVE